MVPSPGRGGCPVKDEQNWSQQLFLLLRPGKPHSIPARMPAHHSPSHPPLFTWQILGGMCARLSRPVLGVCCRSLDPLQIITQDKQLSSTPRPEQCHKRRQKQALVHSQYLWRVFTSWILEGLGAFTERLRYIDSFSAYFWKGLAKAHPLLPFARKIILRCPFSLLSELLRILHGPAQISPLLWSLAELVILRSWLILHSLSYSQLIHLVVCLTNTSWVPRRARSCALRKTSKMKISATRMPWNGCPSIPIDFSRAETCPQNSAEGLAQRRCLTLQNRKLINWIKRRMYKDFALEHGLWSVQKEGSWRAMSFFPWVMKVLLSVRKPTLLIRPCNTIHSDTLLVKSMRAAEICILTALECGTGLEVCMLMSKRGCKSTFSFCWLAFVHFQFELAFRVGEGKEARRCILHRITSLS